MAEQRIQKVLADQGICSRREAERLIAAGKVKVNGHPVTLGDKMDPDYDKVMIDGRHSASCASASTPISLLAQANAANLTTRSRRPWPQDRHGSVSDVPPCCARGPPGQGQRGASCS